MPQSALPTAPVSAQPQWNDFQIGLVNYRAGLETRQFVSAYRFFQKAASSGQPEATLAAAYLLAMGKGVEPDQVRARELLASLPLTLWPRAAYIRGLIAEQHSNTSYARQESRAWWECAAQMGDELAIHRLAVLKERSGQQKEAKLLYERAQADGVKSGGENLSRLSQTQEENLTPEALRDIKMRASIGDIESMFQLARAYHRGSLMPVNISSALYWYQAAAKGGHPRARQFAQLMVINQDHNMRLDYGWIARLAWAEPGKKTAGLSNSASQQAISEQEDALYRIEYLVGQGKQWPLCEKYLAK
jgi:TPR repeat protein